MTTLKNSLDPMGGQVFFLPVRSVCRRGSVIVDGTRTGNSFSMPQAYGKKFYSHIPLMGTSPHMGRAVPQ